MDSWFYNHIDAAASFVLGIIGAGTRVAIGQDRGEKQGRWRIIATFLAGSTLAATSTQATIEYIGMSSMMGGGISFFIGLFGLGFIYRILDGKIHIPLFSKGVEK
jgi:MFS superfamily sulfate permease-like transporter